MSSLPGLGGGAPGGTGHTLYKPASMHPAAGTLGLSGLEALQLNDAGGLVAAAGLDTGLGVGGLGLGGALPYRSLGGLAGLQSSMQQGVFDALGTGGREGGLGSACALRCRTLLCACCWALVTLIRTCLELYVGTLCVVGWSVCAALTCDAAYVRCRQQ